MPLVRSLCDYPTFALVHAAEPIYAQLCIEWWMFPAVELNLLDEELWK